MDITGGNPPFCFFKNLFPDIGKASVRSSGRSMLSVCV